MKLSMWMIANRLSPLMDLKTNISADARPVLNSARLVYSTNCVHVYQEQDYVVCSGEGDSIYLYGVTEKEAFEIIQGVFDYFQDWEADLQAFIRKNDFQKIVNSCEILIQNPMDIQDANNKLLAISRHPDPAAVDPEWLYMSRYGYSSLNAIKALDLSQSNTDFTRHGVQPFSPADSSGLRHGGISYCLQYNGIDCGRMTILEMLRPINPGDYQLLDKIAQLLEPVMGNAVLSDHSPSQFNALYSLVFQKSYDVRELQLQLAYQQWTEGDDFQMLLIQPDYLQNTYRSVEILYSILLHNLPSCVIFRKDPYILVLSNQLLEKRHNLLDFLGTLHENNKIRAAFSIGAKGTAEIPWMVRQCLFAMKAAESENTENWLFYFEKYAVDYMLFHARGNEQIHACHPMVRKLWDEKEKNEDELFKTLMIYLDNERSVNKTSAALFTHRNTVMYRIRKLQETYSLNLDDPGTRYYLRLSMQVLASPVRQSTQFFSGPPLNSNM